MSSNILIGNSFADLPALLMRAGRADLVPDPTTIGTDDSSHGAPVARAAYAPVEAPTHPAEPPSTGAGQHAHPAALATGGDGETTDSSEAGELATLFAELEAAAQALGDLARRDEAARKAALEALDRYDAAVAGEAQA